MQKKWSFFCLRYFYLYFLWGIAQGSKWALLVEANGCWFFCFISVNFFLFWFSLTLAFFFLIWSALIWELVFSYFFCLLWKTRFIIFSTWLHLANNLGNMALVLWCILGKLLCYIFSLVVSLGPKCRVSVFVDKGDILFYTVGIKWEEKKRFSHLFVDFDITREKLWDFLLLYSLLIWFLLEQKVN